MNILLRWGSIILLFIPGVVYPQPGTSITDSSSHSSIKRFHFVTNLPYDLLKIGTSPFEKRNLKGLAVTAGLTLLLLPLDQPVTNGVKHLFRQLSIDPDTRYSVPIKVGGTKILKVPQNLTSALYQLGEGGTSMMVAAGFFISGKLMRNKKAVNTAGDITETFLTMGVATQVIKRISGRESPFVATKAGGRWHPFPSFKKYQAHTPQYDAFPSGHLATMMATVSTIAMNYPDKKWVKPLGYGLTALTGIAMINTEVHWISDYPLALALGYVSARITHEKNHKKVAVFPSVNL